jgi:hypothetical protein
MRNHFSPLWEKTLSDERQFYGATSVAPPGLDPVVTWGVPFNYFRRLLHSIFRAGRKNFNGTADTCTFVDTAVTESRNTHARQHQFSANLDTISAPSG